MTLLIKLIDNWQQQGVNLFSGISLKHQLQMLRVLYSNKVELLGSKSLSRLEKIRRKFMFMGIYWSQRQETREEAAERIALFLQSIANIGGGMFESWFKKARSKKAATTSVVCTPAGIASYMRVNRRDVGKQVMQELGFSMDIWNGGDAELGAGVGAFSPYVGNRVVLSFSEKKDSLNLTDWRQILEVAIAAFDPDYGVVTSSDHLQKMGVKHPWEAGCLTYQRGRDIEPHPFP